MDDLTGVDVDAGAQRSNQVKQRHRLPDTARAGEDHEPIVDRRGRGDVLEDVGPVSQVVPLSIKQEPVSAHPAKRVRSTRRSSPPRVGVSDGSAQLVVPHGIHHSQQR